MSVNRSPKLSFLPLLFLFFVICSMGVRSQLYLITGRSERSDDYVCIAGAHQQFFEAMPMILALHNLLETITNVKNTRLLLAERHALQKTVETSKDIYVYHQFATELLIHAASTYKYLSGNRPSSFAQAQYLHPCEIEDPSRVDNDNGMLAVDITNPAKPEYCFILFQAEDESKTFVPLDAPAYYQASYYQNEIVKDPAYQGKWKNLLESLKKYAIITADRINGTWDDLANEHDDEEEKVHHTQDTQVAEQKKEKQVLSLKTGSVKEILKNWMNRNM